jgi:hypothetical protein
MRYLMVGVLLLTGCHSVKSTGVMPYGVGNNGEDRYTISTRAYHGHDTEARRKAMTAAFKYCERQERVMIPYNESTRQDRTRGATDLVFVCKDSANPTFINKEQ